MESFPRQCSAPEHNVGEEFSHKWKLVVLVDDLLNIAGITDQKWHGCKDGLFVNYRKVT